MNRVILLLLLLLQAVSFADQVLWEYDLTEVPPGWGYSAEWEFTSEGMSVFFDCYMGGYMNESVLTGLVMVPMGTDSLTMAIDQLYIAWLGGYASVHASIYINVNGQGWDSIWYLAGQQIDSTAVFESITEVDPADILRFRFEGGGGGVEFSSFYLDWTLCDLVLTAHGDIQSLSSRTWAGIKSLF